MLRDLDALDDSDKAFTPNNKGIEEWSGGKGGGYPEKLPKWIPSDIYKKYQGAMDEEYSKAMEAAGYDPDDDPLGFSETDFGEYVGVAMVSADGKLSESKQEDLGGGICSNFIKPIPFTSKDGKKLFLYGFYAGL